MNQPTQSPTGIKKKDEETDASDPENTPRPIAVYLVLAAILYAVVQSFSLLSPILLSFFLIVLITLALNPIISLMRAWTGGRKRATGLMLAGVLTLGGLSIWAAAVPLKHAVAALSEKLPAYWERLQKPLIRMEQHSVISETKLQQEVSAEIAREIPEAAKVVPSLQRKAAEKAETENTEGSIRSSLGGMIGGVFGEISGLAQNTTEFLVVLVTVFFGVTFTLMNPRPIFGALFSIVPEKNHMRALAIMIRIARFVPRWAASVLISMLTIGSLFFLLMWPIFGFGDALMLGLVAFLLSAIPFLGPLLTLIPALLLAIGEGGLTPVWVLLAYGAVQALEGNVILPIIMSRGMKLHPLAVIFSMLFSVAVFGVLGVLIAAPLVAIVGILNDELYRKHFLPTVTDEDLERLARIALLEKRSVES